MLNHFHVSRNIYDDTMRFHQINEYTTINKVIVQINTLSSEIKCALTGSLVKRGLDISH